MATQPHPPSQPTHWFATWIPISAIILIAACMRLWQVDQPLVDAFSWRQSSTAMMAENFYRHGYNILYPAVHWNGPQLSYQGREFQTVSYLAALLYAVFGQQEIIGRFVTIAFGTWGVFALYHLARRVWDEPRAIYSAAILAVMPGAVFIDRSFLPDPAMVALATTTLWVWVAYLQTGKKLYLALTAIIGMWAIASKLPALLVALPAAYAAYAILGDRMFHTRRLLTFLGLAIIVLVPVTMYYLWVRELSRSYPPYHFAGSANWIWVDGLAAWLRQGYYLPSLANTVQTWLWTLPVIVLVAVGLLLSPSNDTPSTPDQRRAPWLFHLWAAGCLFYLVIGARELSENVWNLHIFNPAAAALAGLALVRINRLGEKLTLFAPASLIIVGVVLIWGFMAVRVMYQPYAQDGYEMGLALRQLTAPGDLVVTMANDLGDPVAIYYSRRRGWIFPPPYPNRWWNRLPKDDAQSIQDFEQLRAEGARWLAFVRRFDKESWVGHEKLIAHFDGACDWVAGKPDTNWVICRIKP